MNEIDQLLFMQVRILRLAAEEWETTVQKASEIFDRYGIYKYIEECYDVFHMEGDYAVLDEIRTYLRCKGVDIRAEIK